MNKLDFSQRIARVVPVEVETSRRGFKISSIAQEQNSNYVAKIKALERARSPEEKPSLATSIPQEERAKSSKIEQEFFTRAKKMRAKADSLMANINVTRTKVEDDKLPMEREPSTYQRAMSRIDAARFDPRALKKRIARAKSAHRAATMSELDFIAANKELAAKEAERRESAAVSRARADERVIAARLFQYEKEETDRRHICEEAQLTYRPPRVDPVKSDPFVQMVVRNRMKSSHSPTRRNDRSDDSIQFQQQQQQKSPSHVVSGWDYDM